MSIDSKLDVVTGVEISTWSVVETCGAVNAEDDVGGADYIGSLSVRKS